MNLLLSLAACCLIFFLITTIVLIRSDERPRHRSAAVVVLGDIGRSPRMMYHAESFASNGFETYVIAYKGSRVIPSLLTMPHVRFLYLPSFFVSRIHRRAFFILAPIKAIFQLFTMLHVLLYGLRYPPQFILVQNPPSIPSLALVWLVAKLRGSKVIIDWHNLGYSILALRLGHRHPLVRVARRFEIFFGRSAFAHLFVTNSMKKYLVDEWHLQGKALVLYDRPPSHFRACLPSEIHDLFLRLSPSIDELLLPFLPSFTLPASTPFTELAPAEAFSELSTSSSSLVHKMRSERPALVISSTSWTEDENFDILLEALRIYEAEASSRRNSNYSSLPKLFAIVTGKGPLRDSYMHKIHALELKEKWEFVRCRSFWLEPEDYPLLLGAADLGISLHSSSSALDLPMKVVDMFGCSLPVLALNFKCLSELVYDGKNGLVFDNADELALRLCTVLEGYPNSTRLMALRSYFQSSNPEWRWCSWSDNWNSIVRPVVAYNDSSIRSTGVEELSKYDGPS